MAIEVQNWLDVIDREYLRRFIPMGGAGLKFAIITDSLDEAIGERLRSTTDRGFSFVRVDAATTKLHLIHDFFFAVARQIDWEDLARRRVDQMIRDLQYRRPKEGSSTSLSELAEANDIGEGLVALNVDRWLTKHILNDRAMAQDFREAAAHLCRRRLDPVGPDSGIPVVEWLRGELPALGALRPLQIGSKISRYNARAMLRSTGHWLGLCGAPGVVVTLDIRWISQRDPSPSGIRYTPSAVLDAFEVLRQLIDETGRLENLFLVVIASPALLDGEERRRTLDIYPALKGRVASDVQVRRFDNPLAPLARLAAQGSADLSPPAVPAGEMPLSAERVAIEAIRAGVPNEAAIRLLDGPNDTFTQGFVEDLRSMYTTGGGRIGRIAAGGFGTGKSHLLMRLAEYAKSQNYVVSTVSVSKETPLFSLERVFAAAVRNAIVPDINDDVMSVAISRLEAKPPALAQLEDWASAPETGLGDIFPALLHVIPRNILSPEDKVAVARFLGGGRLGTGKLRAWLKAAGAARLFDVRPVKAPELALQRLRFAPALLRAAGFSGWCVLLDEVELIGRYSTLQRARSYAELSRWLGLAPQGPISGLISVGAIVDDFKDVVLDGRFDREKAPRALEAKNLSELIPFADAAMELIEKNAARLSPPDSAALAERLSAIAELYQKSYDWTPPPTEVGEQLGGKTMREYVKSWVTSWDIQRLFGDRTGTINIDISPQGPTDFTENKDFEAAAPEEPED